MNFGYQTETVPLNCPPFFLPSRHKDPSLLPQAVCEIQPCCIFAHRSSSDHFYNLCIAAQFMMWTALPLPSISLSFPIFIKNNFFWVVVCPHFDIHVSGSAIFVRQKKKQ